MSVLAGIVFNPYTDFVLAAAGIALGTLVLTQVTGLRLRSTTGMALVLATLAGVLVLPTLWRAAVQLQVDRDGLLKPTADVRLDRCLWAADGQVEVAAQVARHIGPDDTFTLQAMSVDRACLQLNVLPRRLVSGLDGPDWTLRGAPFDADLRRRIQRDRGRPQEERRVRELGGSRVLIRNR